MTEVDSNPFAGEWCKGRYLSGQEAAEDTGLTEKAMRERNKVVAVVLFVKKGRASGLYWVRVPQV